LDASAGTSFNYDLSKSTMDLTPKQIEMVVDWLPYKPSKIELLYRGTRDGFKAIDFHSRCDN